MKCNNMKKKFIYLFVTFRPIVFPFFCSAEKSRIHLLIALSLDNETRMCESSINNNLNE